MAINPIAKDLLKYLSEDENRINSTIEDIRGFNERQMHAFLTLPGAYPEIIGYDSNQGGRALIFASDNDFKNTGDEYAYLSILRLANCEILDKDSNSLFVTETFQTWAVNFGFATLDNPSADQALNWFFNYYLISYSAKKITMETAKSIIIDRLNIWKSYIGEDGITDEDLVALELKEKINTTEKDKELEDNKTEDEVTKDYLTDFRIFLHNVYGSDPINETNDVDGVIKKYFSTNRGSEFEADEKTISTTSRIFGLGASGPIELDSGTSKSIYARLESSGILQLASFAYEISNFAKKRLQSVATAKRSMDEYTSPEIDTPWLTILSEVVYNLQKDPISFSIINFYFPSLVTFVFDALAAVGDYSNNGKGGGAEDTLNNEADAMDSLEKAFGVTKGGEAIFTLAFKVDSTAKRIKQALVDFPFRENIPPRKPDIFHLRLGAANFYVPPISISVNSNFKTGSLTGGAIRQKNTPKFNAGYKETTISMRLFFPNYEEIWGLSISDAATLNLDESFKIDFKNGGDDEEKIDKFLSSLRGLVAAFKYSPILPIKNDYLNSVHGITAVGLSNMSIATAPNYPFALVIDLEMVHFNHKPFLPMLKDFNQAIHWGKYRQYMGKAAGEMHRYVNESFLIKTSDNKTVDTVVDQGALTAAGLEAQSEVFDINVLPEDVKLTYLNSFENDVLSTNIISQWRDGSNITLFTPAEVQTKIFLPDNTSFRSEQEKILNDTASGLWDKLLNSFGIERSVNSPLIKDLDGVRSMSLESTPKSMRNFLKQAIDVLTAGISTTDTKKKVYLYLAKSFVAENATRLDEEQKKWLTDYLGPEERVLVAGYFYQYDSTEESYYLDGVLKSDISLNEIKYRFDQRADNSGEILDILIDEEIARQTKSTGIEPDREKVKQQVTEAFQVNMYERFFTDGFVKNMMEATRLKDGDYHFNEWEVPMNRVDLDPKNAIVNGVSVSMGNNLAKLQIQMQDEPSYQYIGGKDSYINVSMTVFGEKELLKIRSVFDHVNGLARLEHSTGVIGFLGIKNIITALSGIKYVLPLNYKVDTIPNYPHVYSVQLSLVDFDIFQQQREKISSKQQQDLIEHFGTKRNPFLRMKQLWGSFNAYPDLPLGVKDKNGDIVGNLDPDFYFRSFEMFDRDIINNNTTQVDLTKAFTFDSTDKWASNTDGPGGADAIERKIESVKNRIKDFMRRYSFTDAANAAAIESRRQTNQDLINEIIDYVNESGISIHNFIALFQESILGANNETAKDYALLTDYIFLASQSSESSQLFEEFNGAPFVIGNVGITSSQTEDIIAQVLSGSHLAEEEFISFDPDEVEFHKIINLIPLTNPEEQSASEIPAIMYSALGTHFGYINKDNGRFYLTSEGINVKIEDGAKKLESNYVKDMQTPDTGCTNSLTGISGAQPLSAYQKAYDGSFNNHMEKMLNDVQYRDISGRMIRAFPTYMLWLIDEGGMFAGVKLFDNFYGLQSVIDFSVVSSEDLLGDTLILRVSNMYSKLTTRPSTDIFNAGNDDFNNDPLTPVDGISAILDRTLNIAKNIISGMRNDYVVDINNIRLKPGVRLHLRGGYGSNPNSLQTLFNGVITNVEEGEIVTITAQSDAIELGAVVNSTNKKGDSGKIDGGVDTGMYLSEPRDLMVRLLSMGASRVREAIARATLGTVFSENRFGIRHFGTILYEPINEVERQRADGLRNVVTNAYANAGQGDIGGAANAATFKLSTNVFQRNPVNAFFGDGKIMTSMGQLMSNFSSEVDLELYKRNIYPGNGTGFAQFLGGDLDDGWLTAASLVEGDGKTLAGQAYLENGTDRSWNRVIVEAQNGSVSASATIDSYVESNELVSAEGRAGVVKNVLLGGLTAGIAAIPGVNVIAGIAGGGALMGLLRGRGGTNVFRTMGIIAPNADDDLSGFDEVSFRAQTYMRTVWDLFQMCARLLPNYIVAVRPFEDRSTIFYGKPHWLYTSGVVPVTTGFPSVRKANELNLPGYPKDRSPDDDIQTIMNNVNKQSNSLADYEAFKRSEELSDVMAGLAIDQASSTGEYAPTKSLSKKLLNFNSNLAKIRTTKDADGNEIIISKLPISSGKVKMGFHLPVSTNPTTYAPLTPSYDHRQLDNLPVRFKYPFYTISETTVLDKKSYEIRDGGLLSGFTEWLGAKNEIATNDLDYLELNQKDVMDRYNEAIKSSEYTEGGATLAVNLIYFLQLESRFLQETKITIRPSSGILELDRPLGFTSLMDSIDSSGVEFLNLDQTTVARMPLPSVSSLQKENYPLVGFEMINSTTAQTGENSDDFSFEYELNQQITYEEWGCPATTAEEQFYIAMKWPYLPTTSDGPIPDASLSKFKDIYFPNEDLYGTASDYKKRRVLVFSPLTGRAVVCAPAYFMWGEDNDEEVAAVVSPDAAWYLGTFVSSFFNQGAGLISELSESLPAWANLQSYDENTLDMSIANSTYGLLERTSGLSTFPRDVDCLFAFVPDSTPLGVVSEAAAPAKRFYDTTDTNAYIIGFGNFAIDDNGDSSKFIASKKIVGPGDFGQPSVGDYFKLDGDKDSSLEEYSAQNAKITAINYEYGGNILQSGDDPSYFQAILDKDYDALDKGKLYERLDKESYDTGDRDTGGQRVGFAAVYSPMDSTSVEARSFYDENFDPNVSVIAGNGRTLNQASDIWDQFRFGYHTYESVKAIFTKTYGMDADSTDPFPEEFSKILGANNTTSFQNFSESNIKIPGLSATDGTGVDELAILLGSDFFNSETEYGSNYGSAKSTPQDKIEAVEFIRKNYIDYQSKGVQGDAGIIQYFNSVISRSLDGIRSNFFETQVINNALSISIENKDNPETAINLSEAVKTPKQLFLLMVGLFRQKLWNSGYGRAWLVLKPDRKRGVITAGGGGKDGQWSFKPIDKVFEAFINPYSQYAKDNSKFLKLLVSTKGEGSNSSTFIGGIDEDVSDFYNANIGPILGAIGDGLSSLLGMFKLSMMQMGYALSEVGNFSKQAHILNKVLNDSIYYSLGRPGTLLRAVDNPFTREYGEPVVEVRQPFQRIHYLSSFSHIISNQIQENLNNVSTVITAVSDGKNPVTVALDKGAPSERQTETTVETGLYYDNMVGSGFLGVLHPFMHPLESFRGYAKTLQGTPDELSARRVALSHLKESIKDIYGGELTLVGNPDIRPHDLVYLSDVYSRMYGIFEVEQVVHHFTSEMGYITSITPNALVTVNDPSRWFMSTWLHSWLSMQNLRNDTRFYMDNIMASNSGINMGGNISVDALADSLSTQMIGGIQYTHGSSALMKDIMANQTALSLPEKAGDEIAKAGQGKVPGADTVIAVVGASLARAIPVVGQLAWKGWTWLRDNVLDQHGCYVQYLNKNGQPMDAGLSYNQGMVVGRYHTKALLPGILGTKTKVKTPEGNAFIRSDDLLKSLGWQETEIKDLVRYTDYENALTHARVLSLSGLGPEKTALQTSLFKVIAIVTNFKDGDTFEVQDILRPDSAPFTVRFDGMDTGETNTTRVGTLPSQPGGDVNYPFDNTTTLTSTSTPGGRAKIYTQSKLSNKVFVLRIKVSNSSSNDVIFEAQFEPGATENTLANYTKDSFMGDEGTRAMATVWYYQPESVINQAKDFVRSCFATNRGKVIEVGDLSNPVTQKFFTSIYEESPLNVKRLEIINKINTLDIQYTPPLDLSVQSVADYGLTEEDFTRFYNNLVCFKVLEATYEKVNDWPTIFWDEYYEDGYPVTLNWELVVNNLAKVYTKQLQIESQSVISAEESALIPRQVTLNPGT